MEMKCQRFALSGLWKQYIAAVSACLSIFTSATCYGWLTPILDHLMGPDSEIPMEASQLPWIITVIEVGNLFSPIPAGRLVNYVGRKPVILATGPLYILSWLLILHYPSTTVLAIVRVLQGFAMGFAYTATPVYLGEIASKSTRGAITSIFFNSWWLGFVVEYAAGPFLSFYNFTYFTLALNIPFLLIFSWQPESPYYYMMKGNEKKAREALTLLRDPSPQELNDEFEEMKQSVEESMNATRMRDIVATPGDKKALYLLMVLSSMRILSGTAAISVYATQIFNLTPNLPISSDMITLALGIVTFVGGCIGSCITDSLGRRPLFLFSCAGSLICQLCTGTFYYLYFKTSVEVSKFSWISPILILVYSGICCAGIYPVCSSYTSELFTSHSRGYASSLSSVIVTFSFFIAIISYQPVTYHFGLYTNFFLFSFYILIGTFIFYFLAPETKGKSFIQIRRDLCKTT